MDRRKGIFHLCWLTISVCRSVFVLWLLPPCSVWMWLCVPLSLCYGELSLHFLSCSQTVHCAWGRPLCCFPCNIRGKGGSWAEKLLQVSEGNACANIAPLLRQVQWGWIPGVSYRVVKCTSRLCFVMLGQKRLRALHFKILPVAHGTLLFVHNLGDTLMSLWVVKVPKNYLAGVAVGVLTAGMCEHWHMLSRHFWTESPRDWGAQPWGKLSLRAQHWQSRKVLDIPANTDMEACLLHGSKGMSGWMTWNVLHQIEGVSDPISGSKGDRLDRSSRRNQK